jgi:hypothetical protein
MARYNLPRPSISYYRPYETVTEYGRPEFEQALQDWRTRYGDYSSMLGGVTPQLQQMMGYYAPGGGYGAGLREEATETVRGGVSRDLSSMVAGGMSSQFGARGTQTRASSELSKMYKNIEDTRNQLWMQAVQPYAQMMQTMAAFEQSRPTYAQYVRPVTTSQYGWGEPKYF